MTPTITTPTPVLRPSSAAHESIPFRRLLGVEWSKATDTRSARWLLALVGVITTGMTLGVPILAPTNFEQSHASYLRLAALGLIILLPVVAILMLTGEWSQRSIITTFTQEPRRMRVINAKLVVSMMLGGLGAVFGGVVTAGGIGLAAISGRSLDSDLTVGAIVGYLLFVLINVLAGVALGALLHNSAAAIAVSFALPAIFAVLGTASKFVSEWIDTESSWTWLLKSEWAGHVPQILLSVILWVAFPLAGGIIRTMRRDVA